MRAASGPLAMFVEGTRRLIRAPLPLAALWLPSAIVTWATGEPPSLVHFDLVTDSGSLDVRRAIGIALWLVLSSFLWGGVLTRYAHPGTTGMSAFLVGGRAFGGRILRLALLSVAVSLIFTLSMRPDVPPEDDVVPNPLTAADLAGFAVFGVYLFLQLWITLAEVRTIVEDRRSLLFAFAAGWRLLMARPLAVLGIYALAGVALVGGLIFSFFVLLPGIVPSRDSVWPERLLGQTMTVALMWFDLQLSASLIALYQAEMVRLRPEDALATSSGLSGLNALTAKE
jgi:hypothetical protein